MTQSPRSRQSGGRRVPGFPQVKHSEEEPCKNRTRSVARASWHRPCTGREADYGENNVMTHSLVYAPRTLFGRSLLAGVRTLFSHVDRFSPPLGARWAEFLLRRPPRICRSRRETAILEAGESSTLAMDQGRLAVWTWGQGPPVLLVHGWAGHAGRLAGFVEPLVQAGYSVVAFDAPGHGASSGPFGSLPEFVEAIRTVSSNLRPLAAVIAHSLGASAAALAMQRGVRADSAIFLSPLSDIEEHTARFSRWLGIPERTHREMKRRLASSYRMRWRDLQVAEAVRGLDTPLLILHDERDVKVPIRHGEALASAWPGATLRRTRGLGHHGILRDRNIVEEAIAFLTPSAGVNQARQSAG